MVDPDSPHAWTHSGVVLGVALVALRLGVCVIADASDRGQGQMPRTPRGIGVNHLEQRVRGAGGVAPRTRVPVSID